KLTGNDQLGKALTEVDQSATTLVVNLPPTFDPTPDQAVDFNDPLTFTVTAHDPEAIDTLTMSASGLPAGLNFVDNGNGTLTVSGTPTATPGAYSVTVSVDDHHHTSPVTQTIRVTVNKEESSVSSTTGLQVLAAGSPVNLSATLTDPDGGAPIGGKTVMIT